MSKLSVTLTGSGASRTLAPKLANLLISKGKAELKDDVKPKGKPKK